MLLEEYGAGRLPKKHSTFYRAMMQETGLDTTEEAYLDLVPWQVSGCHLFVILTYGRYELGACAGVFGQCEHIDTHCARWQ